MMRFFLVICVLSLMQMTFAVIVKYDILNNIPTPAYISSALFLEIKTPGVVIVEFIGEHLTGKQDSDVLLFDITDQRTDYLPRGLSSKYVNMEILHVMNSGVKSITRDDFTAMPKLKELALFSNQINNIPSNCFDDLIHMERLSLSKNNIKILPQNIFFALPNLNAVYLTQNKLSAIPADLFQNNLKLEYIGFRENNLKFIGGSILSNQKNLKNVNFKNNVCIDDSYPRNSIEKLVKTIKSNCNVDPCIAGSKDIARLQEINKRLAVQQRANDMTINGIIANCPNNHVLAPTVIHPNGSPSVPSPPAPVPAINQPGSPSPVSVQGSPVIFPPGSPVLVPGSPATSPLLPPTPIPLSPPGSPVLVPGSPVTSPLVPHTPNTISPPGSPNLGPNVPVLPLPGPTTTPVPAPLLPTLHHPGSLSTAALSHTFDNSDELQQKYDELRKSYDELAISKDCIYKVHNGASEIELIFHHNV